MDTIYGDGDIDGPFFTGNDIIYGGNGGDTISAGSGDDIIHGDEGEDFIVAGAGDDVIYGGGDNDSIDAGYGWDTIFGGDGCDTIGTLSGGDVIWLGDCDGSSMQKVTINGTGEDPENFTVIMDFWLESAKPWNLICVNDDQQQDNPSAGMCRTDFAPICFNAAELADP